MSMILNCGRIQLNSEMELNEENVGQIKKYINRNIDKCIIQYQQSRKIESMFDSYGCLFSWLMFGLGELPSLTEQELKDLAQQNTAEMIEARMTKDIINPQTKKPEKSNLFLLEKLFHFLLGAEAIIQYTISVMSSNSKTYEMHKNDEKDWREFTKNFYQALEKLLGITNRPFYTIDPGNSTITMDYTTIPYLKIILPYNCRYSLCNEQEHETTRPLSIFENAQNNN